MTGPKIKSEARSPAPARTSRPVPPGEAGTLAAVKQGWENVSTAAQSRRMRVFKYFETAALTQSALPSVDVMASEIGVLSKQMGEYIRRLVTDGLMIKTTHKSFGRYCDHFEIRRGAAAGLTVHRWVSLYSPNPLEAMAKIPAPLPPVFAAISARSGMGLIEFSVDGALWEGLTTKAITDGKRPGQIFVEALSLGFAAMISSGEAR